ncbi:MAG: hypothetical protein ABI673_06010 [Novosphingobium sp.]
MSDWSARLADMALACADAFPCEQARRLRELRELLASAPSLLSSITVPDRATYAALLRAEAWESAALSLLGDDCGYMLSRGTGGRVMASIVLPGADEESTASADTAALAIAAALATALRDTPMRVADRAQSAPFAAMRLN